jgi:hypothetical protein
MGPFQGCFSAVQARYRKMRPRGSAAPRDERKVMRLPRKLVGLLLVAGTLAGITASAVPARAATDASIQFATGTSFAAGSTLLCLEADPGPIFQYQVATQPCNPGNLAQRWVQVDVGNGVSKFVNQAVGWCLYDDTIANGSVIALWDCNANISNTRWTLVWPSVRFSFPTLESRISGSTGHCLDVPGDQNLAGLRTQLWTCNGTNAQRFGPSGSIS